MRNRFTSSFIVLILCLCAFTTAFGQSAKGVISGVVKDVDGAVLQGAQIVLQPTTTTVASDSQGNYLITNVKPGTYSLTISCIGFTSSVSIITVTAGQTTHVGEHSECSIGGTNHKPAECKHRGCGRTYAWSDAAAQRG
jgi:hypothetical protein